MVVRLINGRRWMMELIHSRRIEREDVRRERATGHVMNMRGEQMMATCGDKKVAKGAEAGNDMRSQGQDGTGWNPRMSPSRPDMNGRSV